MLINRTVVLPLDETREYLSSLLSSAPMDINVNSFHIVLIDSKQPIVTDRDAVYDIEATAFNQWYNEQTQQGALILSLKSKNLSARYDGLINAGVKDAWYNEFSPYMVVVPYANPDRLHQRRFIGSIANALCDQNGTNILKFGCELQFQLELEQPPYLEYHNSICGLSVNG